MSRMSYTPGQVLVEKFCPKCRMLRPREDFGISPKLAGGLRCWCKDCEGTRQRAYRAAKPEARRETQRRHREGHAEQYRAKARRYATRHAEKVQARTVLNHAMRKGEITRPDVCDRCGGHGLVCADGRSAIQAHHADYSKPLDVEWLCVNCHTAEHRAAAPDRN